MIPRIDDEIGIIFKCPAQSQLWWSFTRSDGALIGGEGEVGVMVGEGDEEGGWDVGDDDLDLPPDLVRGPARSWMQLSVVCCLQMWRVNI